MATEVPDGPQEEQSAIPDPASQPAGSESTEAAAAASASEAAAADPTPADAPAAPEAPAAPAAEVPPATAPAAEAPQTPDAPVAPVAPVEPVAAPPAAEAAAPAAAVPAPAAPAHVAPAPAAAAPAPAAPGTPPPPPAPPTTGSRRGRLGLALGLGAGGVVVVGGLITAGVLLIPALLNPAAASTSRVSDITSEPDRSWKVGVGASGDYYDSPSLSAVGDSKVLALTTFDYADWEDAQDTGDSPIAWYDGVEADYAAGYEQGAAYGAAYDAYWDCDYWSDSSCPDYPDVDGYLTEHMTEDPRYYYGYYDDDAASGHLGEYVGWEDGYDGAEQGASLPTKPETPVDGSLLQMIDTNGGKELWNREITDVFPEHTAGANIWSYVVGDRLVVVDTGEVWSYSSSSDDAADTTAVVATLSTSDGSTVSSVEVDGGLASATVVGDRLVAVLTGDEAVREFDPAHLDGSSAWASPIDLREADSAWVSRVDDKSFAVTDGDETSYYALADGKETSWSDDVAWGGTLTSGSLGSKASDDETYVMIDGRLYDLESSDDDDAYSFTRIDTSTGKPAWEDPIEGGQVLYVDGQFYVYSSCRDDVCDDLQSYDPSSGKAKWSDPIDADWYPIAKYGDRMLAWSIDWGNLELDQLTLVNLGDGSVVKDADPPHITQDDMDTGVYAGEQLFYTVVKGKLQAYRPTDRQPVWKLSLDDSESIRVLGSKLFLYDSDSQQLIGLAAG